MLLLDSLSGEVTMTKNSKLSVGAVGRNSTDTAKRTCDNGQTQFYIDEVLQDFETCFLERQKGAVVMGICSNDDFTRVVVTTPEYEDDLLMFKFNLYESALKDSKTENGLRVMLEIIASVLHNVKLGKEVKNGK